MTDIEKQSVSASTDPINTTRFVYIALLYPAAFLLLLFVVFSTFMAYINVVYIFMNSAYKFY